MEVGEVIIDDPLARISEKEWKELKRKDKEDKDKLLKDFCDRLMSEHLDLFKRLANR